MKIKHHGHQPPTNPYPSHDVPRKVKSSKKWLLQYAQAFHQDYTGNAHANYNQLVLRFNATNLERYRKYAKGEQNSDQYKELLTIKSNKGKANESYRNLDYGILKIAPKIKEVLHSKITNRSLNIIPKPIDSQSIKEERRVKHQYLEFVHNLERQKKLENTAGLQLPGPGDPNEMMPRTKEEVEPHLANLSFKNQYAAEMKDYIDSIFLVNDFEQIKDECIDDLIDTDLMAARVYVDGKGMIRIRRGIPENMITNLVQHRNFRDKIRVGEYVNMTISDLRQRCGDFFSEEDYRDIASQVAGNRHNHINWKSSSPNSNETTLPYDHERILVLDMEFYSYDKEVAVVKEDKHGNKNVYEKDYYWKPGKTPSDPKGMSDKEYAEKHEGRKILRSTYKNVYKVSWIVNTNYVFDYGLVTNMGKVHNKLQDAEIGWILHSSNFSSLIGRIEVPLDNAQINWLQYQSHAAASRPPGIAIERHALAKLQKGTKGGAGAFDSREAIKQFAESGSFIYDGYDYQGRPLSQLPFKELTNGLSPDAATHLQLIFQNIELIRYITGLNTVSEGSQPDAETSRYLAQAMNFGTDNSLNRMYETVENFTKSVAKRVADLSSDVINNPSQGLDDLIGVESKQFLKLAEGKGLVEFGIDLEVGVDQALKERIMQSVDVAETSKEITADQKIMILMEENPYRMRQMLRKALEENREAAHQMEMEKIQAQEQVNISSTQAAIQLEQTKKQAEYDAKLNYDLRIMAEQEKYDRMKFNREYILAKLNGGQQLEVEELKGAWKLIGIEEQGNIDVELQEMKNEAEKNKPKAKLPA